MRTWDRSEITSYCFLFGVNQVHCFGLKLVVQREKLICIVSAKIRQVGGSLNYEAG